MNLVHELVADASEFTAWRRALHAAPELAFEEHATAQRVADLLEGWGLEVERGWAGTGVVARLRRSRAGAAGPGPSIALRADMDALPLQEANTFAHASRHPGTMHACGHDGHTAMLLAAARHLSRADGLHGCVHFIFQPAEERGAGALRMLEAGLFERHPCQAVFALHNWPGMPAGHFGLRSGPMMAGTGGFTITILGRACHAALPHLGVDALLVACQIAQALQLLVSRERNPLDAAVLSITQIHAGDTMNIVPDQAVLKGTVRVLHARVLDALESGLRRVAEATAAAHGAHASVDFRRNYPPLVNHAAESALAADVMRSLVGGQAVDDDIAPTMAAEDFAYLLQRMPGCYAFIGNGSGEHRPSDHGAGPCELHSPSYDFNDALLPIGASYFVRLVERYLGPGT